MKNTSDQIGGGGNFTVKIPGADLKNTPFVNVKFTFVLVTPELAADWLKNNRKNRKLKAATLEAYTMDMRNGAWMTTHQCVAFDEDGNLIDGQHRLHGVVQSKTAVLMVVSTGWPAASGKRKTMDAVDRGVQRSLADQLHLQHDIHPTEARRAVQLCNALAAASFGLSRVRKSTTDTILAVFALYKNDLTWVMSHKLDGRGINQATVVASLAMARALWPEQTGDFIVRLNTGENLATGNPVLSLRNWLMGPGFGEEVSLIRQVTLHHICAAKDGVQLPQAVTNSDKAYRRVLALHRVRAEQICKIYNQPMPEFLREKAKESAVDARKVGPTDPEAIKVGQSLGMTFTTTDLIARTDGNVGMWLGVWLNKRWIESGGINQFRKTAAFPS
jgi:hypothetical protein